MDLEVMRTAPREVQGLQLAFDPMLGLVAHHFPKTTGFTDESLAVARQTAGAIIVEGSGGVGTRVTITAANGEAVYELVYRARFVSGANGTGYCAERRAVKLKVAGKEDVLHTYSTMVGFTDVWPAYAGFTQAFLTSGPPHVDRNGALLTIRADGVVGDYLLRLPHPTVRGGWLAERSRLMSSDGIVVTLPTASMQSKLQH